jgi:REP element-mobilizing transposase RayT
MRLPDGSRRRQTLRLRGYDYGQAGAYFVTICTRDRACLLGDVVDDEVRLSDAGRVVQETLDGLAGHYPHVHVDASAVMPDHVHAVIVIRDMDSAGAGVTPVGAGFKPAPTCVGDGVGVGVGVGVGDGVGDGVGVDDGVGDGVGVDDGVGDGVGVGDDTRDVGAGVTSAGAGVTSVRAGLKPARTRAGARHGLPEIVRAFKTFSARRINEMAGTPGTATWQRGYYERIVRSHDDLIRIRGYIASNPREWTPGG